MYTDTRIYIIYIYICIRLAGDREPRAVLLFCRELVPDLTKANDKRQLWLEARDALSRQSVCMRRLLDDEESFAAFVGVASLVAVNRWLCQVQVYIHLSYISM